MGKDVYEEIFLKEKIVFLDVDDLYRRIKDIRKGYLSLEKGVQRVYKWYFFFQLSIGRADDLKSAMWSFINCENEEIYYENVVKEYEEFDERRKKLFKSQI
jgi:hypothetical protein